MTLRSKMTVPSVTLTEFVAAWIVILCPWVLLLEQPAVEVGPPLARESDLALPAGHYWIGTVDFDQFYAEPRDDA